MNTEETNVSFRLRAVEDGLREVKEVLGQVRDKVISTPVCPAPGRCIDLTARVEAQEARIAALEKYQARLIGGGAALIAIASVIGPKISALVFK